MLTRVFSSRSVELKAVTPVTLWLLTLLVKSRLCWSLSAPLIWQIYSLHWQHLFLSPYGQICIRYTLPYVSNPTPAICDTIQLFGPGLTLITNGTPPCSHCFREPVSLLPTTVFPVHQLQDFGTLAHHPVFSRTPNDQLSSELLLPCWASCSEYGLGTFLTLACHSD